MIFLSEKNKFFFWIRKKKLSLKFMISLFNDYKIAQHKYARENMMKNI